MISYNQPQTAVEHIWDANGRNPNLCHVSAGVSEMRLSHPLMHSPVTSAISSYFPSRLFSVSCYCSIQWYTCRTSLLPLLLLEWACDRSSAVVWPNSLCCCDTGSLENSMGSCLGTCVLILKVEPCLLRQAKGENAVSKSPISEASDVQSTVRHVLCLYILNRITVTRCMQLKSCCFSCLRCLIFMIIKFIPRYRAYSYRLFLLLCKDAPGKSKFLPAVLLCWRQQDLAPSSEAGFSLL